jgi:thymidylate kinase
MTAMPLQWVMEINKMAKELAKPDMYIFIDVSIETCLERIYKNRNTTADIFENEKSLVAARNNFLEIFEKTRGDENVVIIDGNSSLESVADEVFEKVKSLYI